MSSQFDYTQLDLKMYRNDTFSRSFTVITAPNEPFDLTNYAVKMTVKWNITDADVDAFLVLTEGAGITVTSAVDGEFDVQIENTDTEDLPSKRIDFVYDIQISYNTTVYTVAYGKLVVLPDVSVSIA